MAVPAILKGLATAAQAVRDVNAGVGMIGGFANEVKQLGQTMRTVGRAAADPGGTMFDMGTWAVRHSVGGAFVERKLERAGEAASAVGRAYGAGETVDRTTTALRGLAGAARNLSQGFLGIITAAAKFVGVVDTWSNQAIQSQSRLAGYSSEMAGALVGLRFGRLQRDIRFAQQTGASFGELADARNRFEEAQLPVREELQELENRALARLTNVATSILEVANTVLVPVLEKLNDWLKGEELDKPERDRRDMFTTIMDGVEMHWRAREDREKRRRSI